MSRQQVLQVGIAVILVILFLVGCGGNAPTAVSEAPAATAASEQVAATPTSEPPTSTPMPEPPTATPTTEPTTVPTPAPIVLPSGLKKVAIGVAFNNEKDCEITKPLSAPIKFPAGTTHFAFQVVSDPGKVDIQISLDGEGLSEGATAKNCDKYTVVEGAPQQYQWGATISSTSGKALKSGIYMLTINVNGQKVEVPFEIE